jgi:SAM-dependent methyltransferase
MAVESSEYPSRVPPDRVSSWDLIVGVTGLALCRHVLSGPRHRSRQRIEELRALLATGDTGWEALPAAELTPEAGYALWAAAYDAPGNPLIGVEQPIIWALLDRAPRGRALDAACGTGRHAGHLAAMGHEVVGVDSSAEMLEVAQRRLPDVGLRQASIESLPFPDGRFDLAVCALALTHLPSLDLAIAELARVVRPSGGRLVLSDVHPSFVAVLDGQARFRSPDGSGGFIRNHVHLHADYLTAFRREGLDVLDCVEPVMGAEDAQAEPLHRLAPEAVTDAMVGLPYLLIWELVRR